MGSAPLEDVHKKLEALLETCELKKIKKRVDYRLYLALPASVMEKFHITTPNSTYGLQYSVEKVFYPHISTEAFPDVFHLLSHDCMNYDTETYCENEKFFTSPFKFLSRVVQQFGLTLIRIQR
jgi:phosphatidylinositol glycan class Z